MRQAGKLLVLIILGVLLATFAYGVQFAPKAFHKQWLRDQPAYDVESELYHSRLYRRVMQTLVSAGVSPDSAIIDSLLKMQKPYIDRATAKIDVKDGEQLIFQFDREIVFWTQLESGRDQSIVLPKIIYYIDKLAAQPKASRWANTESLIYINRFVAYYIANYGKIDWSPSKEIETRKHIVRLMSDLGSRILPEEYAAESQSAYRALPLSWNDVLFTAAGQLVINQKTHKIDACDYEMISILYAARDRLKNTLDVYADIKGDSNLSYWQRTGYSHLYKEYLPIEPIIKKKCPGA